MHLLLLAICHIDRNYACMHAIYQQFSPCVTVSQENLSPGNCVAATVLIMPLTISVATIYPEEILSSGNTVARHGSV